MLNLLNTSLGQYLHDNIVLTVVLAIILALIAVLAGIMIYLQVKAKKNGGTPNAENTENPENTENKIAEETEVPAEEVPAAADENKSEEMVPSPANPVAEENKAEKVETPAQKPDGKPAVKPELKKEAQKPVEEEKDEDDKIGFRDGKWIIRKTDEGKFLFKLYAANGGIMLESSKEYSSLSTAKKGIETYKKSFSDNNCKIIATKNGHFVYRLLNANGMLLAVSSNYTSKSSCENALESTRRYALNAPLEIITD